MKKCIRKILGITTAILVAINMSMLVFAGENKTVEIDLWNATSDKASMGNVATDNNEEALYNPETNTLQIAFNPVNISGYISGVTTLLYDSTGNGDFLEAVILERGIVESGTRNDGQNYTVEYIQVLEIEVPSNLKKVGVEYIDLQIKVPHTPMDSVILDGYLDARLRIDWDTIKNTELSQIIADSTMSGGEIANISLQDKSTGIRIIGDSSKVTSDALLYVEKITTGSEFEKAKSALDTDKFDLYDVRLGVNNTEISMMGAAEVRIPYTGNVEVYRISDDGKKTLLRGSVSNSEYSFLTNQVGLIAVAGGTKQNITLVDGATDNGSLNSATNANNNNESSTILANSNPFSDINTHWAKDNILYAVEQGLFSGVTATTFAPDNDMTGAMVISVLHRIAGSPDTATDDTSWYAKAVAWGYANNIIGDYNDFDPNRSVTREEFATMLFYFEKMSNSNMENGDLSKFTDNNEISSWAKDGLSWANSVGIVSGTTLTTISPQDNASRAVIATMLCRYIDL